MLGLGLNEYNAIGGNAVSSYSWNTQYRCSNSISYAVLKTSGFKTSIYGGLGIATLIYGKQNLDGNFLDLSSKEISGLLYHPN
jgi:hypothetical protein